MKYQFRLPILARRPKRCSCARLLSRLGKLPAMAWVGSRELPKSCCLFFLNFHSKNTFKGLPKTVNHIKPVVQSDFGLWNNQIISFLQNSSSFRVSQNNPFESSILQVFWWDFSCVSTIPKVGRVLSSDLDVMIFVELLDKGNLHEDWCNDDIWNQRKQVPTLLALWLSLLTTVSMRAWVSLTPLLDFQFPPINLLFLEKRFLKRRVLNISFFVKLIYNEGWEVLKRFKFGFKLHILLRKKELSYVEWSKTALTKSSLKWTKETTLWWLWRQSSFIVKNSLCLPNLS